MAKSRTIWDTAFFVLPNILRLFLLKVMVKSMQTVNQYEANIEIRPSPKWIALLLILAAFTLVYFDLIWFNSSIRYKVQSFELLLYALAGLILLLDYWRPAAGRYFAIAAVVIALSLGPLWLEIPEFLLLMTLPVIFAAALQSLTTAAATAIVEIILIAGLPTVTPGVAPMSVITTIIAILVTLGAIIAIYRPMYQRNAWLEEFVEDAGRDLAEARESKVEMNQLLEDLAHSNREMMLLSEKLAAMRLIAEEAQQAKAAFAAKISHEFRTPLNMIIGLIDTLTETPEIYGYDLPPTLLNDLDIVHRNSHHLASLINDVLALSQTETGQFTLHREWVDLSENIENAATVVRPLLEKKKLAWQVIVPHDLPQVYCDETRIRQVILNLVSNAARYTEQGGITVAVEKQGHEVLVRVTDTGPGISPEEAERIFEPFYQSSSNRMWRDQGGSGLGLSISRQFIEHHGGQIWLESELNKGSTFFFKLPISPPTPPPAAPGRWISQDWVFLERASWPNLPELPYRQRVVICDETGDLHPLCTPYSDEIEFVDTRSLSETVRAIQECPAHLVILNATSRNNLGPMVEQARKNITDTPIIGCSLPPRLDRAREAGAIDYLIKPVRRADLERVIQALDAPPKRILVVDDNLDILQLFTRMLLICDESLEITTASGGKAALEELRANPPDLMLLDIIMPHMDGWQVLEQKRRDQTIRDIPVAMVSAEDITEQPVHSKVLLATTGSGFSIKKLLDCSFQLAALLMKPDSEPGPTPE